jgi:chloramphenicol-sensitive protein RarD
LTQLPPRSHAQHLQRIGLTAGLSAYLMWGLFPIYFHVLKGKVTASEILAHRVIWSLPVVAVILFRRDALATIKPVFRESKTLGTLFASAMLIAVNWLVFVYAIATERLVEASLGYFINPLVSVALGMVFLRERLDRMQWVSLILALIGVGYLIANATGLPWIALVLAFSFGLYGLVRKTVPVDSPTGFFMETLLLLPFALGYFFQLWNAGESAFFADSGVMWLLILGGPLTAAPLILFTTAARLLPLSTMGFLQYLAPTLQFALAVFAFGEPFDSVRGVAFAFIWTAVGIYIADVLRRRR